jgi:cyclopropane-fatty-acyl-phospholipid synthase
MPIRVVLPDGRQWGRGGAASPVMHIVRPKDFFHRIGQDANIGFGEAYVAGDWTTSNLTDLLTVFATRLATAVPPYAQSLRLWAQQLRADSDSNTVAVARRNAARHYDLSNELFSTFLDDSLTYSCAHFMPGDPDLTRAQLRKIDDILDLAAVRNGSSVIEIGTGWGSLAIRAAQRGATVTTLTLSKEQQCLSEERIRRAGVADRVEIRLQDYREAAGQYDAVISVEMIEAVGAEYWPMYFDTLNRLLRPGGRVALQTIVMPHDRMLVSRRSYTWMNKYIFPGGLIPSIKAIEDGLAEHTDLQIIERCNLGMHYAQTLRCWRERFLAVRGTLSTLGFDDGFERVWEYYLSYSEAGFRSGYLDLSQLCLARCGGL